MKKYMLIIFLFFLTLSAAENIPQIIVKFQDLPAIYKIKIEVIKNINERECTYQRLSIQEQIYEQTILNNSFKGLVGIPDEAEHIRISIRKKNESDSRFIEGGACYLDAHILRDYAIQHAFSTMWHHRVLFQNQFKKLALGQAVIYLKGPDTISRRY